jgi:hypothetical protein
LVPSGPGLYGFVGVPRVFGGMGRPMRFMVTRYAFKYPKPLLIFAEKSAIIMP